MIGKDLAKAIAFLEKDEVIGIPTETVYGLAGNALRPQVVAKIFEVKNRPSFDPLIVHTHALSQVSLFVKDIPDWAEKLAKAFWPGPLTLLLPKTEAIPDLVTSGSELVGLRIPSHPLALELLRSLSFPLAAPSANPFGYISPTTPDHVMDQLGDRIPYVLDGGPCSVGVESTIVGWHKGRPTVFRTGGITTERLEEILGMPLDILASSSKPSAPGMLESHYAPQKPLFIGHIPTLLSAHPGKKIGVLSFYEDYAHRATRAIRLSPSQDLKEASARLFAALRTLDKEESIDLIVSEVFPEEGLGRAINDRLRRASAKR